MSRIITIYYDIVEGIHRNSEGAAIREEEYPYVIYKEKPIANLHLVTDDNLTEYTGLGDSSEVYSVAVDSDWNHDTELMCKTLDANINVVGDWEDDSDLTANPEEGEFSIRLDANNSVYRDKVGTDREEKDCSLELQALNGVGGDVLFAVQIPFRCLNILDDDGAVPPGLSDQYVRAGSAEIDVGTDYVDVTGLGLDDDPEQIICTVRKPNESSLTADQNIFPTVRADSISTDGFIADLSAEVDNGNYILDYLIILSTS